MIHPDEFFDLNNKTIKGIFSECDYVWQGLNHIGQFIDRFVGDKQTILGDVMPGTYLSNKPIYIDKSARIEPGVYIIGPAYIGPNVIVRQGAYIREDVILLSGSVLGHASEAKNSIFLPDSHAPHFNYVGDSILGSRVNLGAGTKLSNLTIVSEKDPVTKARPTIKISINNIDYDTKLAKLGAILGDDVQTGCNAVLNPGCLVGPNTLIYANTSLRKGYHPSNSIIKLRQNIDHVTRH